MQYTLLGLCIKECFLVKMNRLVELLVLVVIISTASGCATPTGYHKITAKYSNGETSAKGAVIKDRTGCLGKEGLWISKYSDGQLKYKGYYRHGALQGKHIGYYPNGQKQFEGSYKDNTPTNTWIFWDENGEILRRENFL